MYKNYINKSDILKWYIFKILLIMRLTTVILLATMLQVSASTFAQKLSYVKKEVSLVQLFKELKKQTGINVVWYDGKLDAGTEINANFNNSPLEEVLDKSLDGLPLSYTIVKNTVVIKAKEKSIFDNIVSVFSAIDVRGKVVDENGVGLPGATVKVKGSPKTATTDQNGYFSLTNVAENATLVISFLGYDVKELKAAENLGSIQMALSSGKLDEVEINAGYYTVTDRERTGNISKVTAETISKQPVNNPLMALQGRVSGLQITQQTGTPGGGFTVRVRGQNSIKSGNDPLYIIDGVIYPSTGISGANTNLILAGTLSGGGPSPLSLINPNDIESIEILKDADATAIYGSRGANGVILITSKKGKEGNTKIDASISQGYSKVGHKVNLLNTNDYLQMRREAYKNDGLPIPVTDYDINGTWDQNKYTDWQKELIGGTASTTSANLNLTGGTLKSNYLIAGNYYTEGTVFPGDFGFKRSGIRSNINLGGSDDRFTASFTATYNYTNSNLPGSDITSNIFLSPNAPDLLDQYGQLNWANNTVLNNPIATLLETSDANTSNLIGNLTLSYKILKNLTIKTSLAYTTIKREELNKTPLTSSAPSRGYTATQRVSYFGNNYNNTLLTEPQITYFSRIGKGKIDLLLGSSIQTNNSQISIIKASNFNSDDLLENLGSATTITNQQSEFFQYRYFAAFGRLNYSLADRYFLNITSRRDGSSRFGKDKQFANFGALGAAWIFSDEKAIKEFLPFLSFGKLRSSYGITGNDQISNYQYLQLWNTSAVYQNSSTLVPDVNAPNADFAWETNKKLEASMQLGFLKDNINIEVSFYRNRSSNLLLFQSLPLSTGVNGTYRNLPAKVQNTGWEFDANFKILNIANIQWSTILNLTVPKNKLLSYPGLESSSDAINYKIGEPLNILKVYNVTVNKQTGAYVFEDNNNNGLQDDADRYLTEFLGQSFFGGLVNTLKFKQFSVDFNFAFAKQKAKRASNNSPGRWNSASPSNQFSDVLLRWQQPGDETSTQKYSTTTANFAITANVINFGNIGIVDASFIKLKSASLSYSLPKNLTSFFKINNATFSLQGQNLFTLTNYIGLDPEKQGIYLPQLRTIMLGLNVTF